MNSILHHLWAGEIDAVVKVNLKGDAYDAIEEKLEADMDLWRSKLSKEDYQRLEKMLNLFRFDLRDLYNEEHFKYGFRLAALIFIDLLTNPLPTQSS